MLSVHSNVTHDVTAGVAATSELNARGTQLPVEPPDPLQPGVWQHAAEYHVVRQHHPPCHQDAPYPQLPPRVRHLLF